MGTRTGTGVLVGGRASAGSQRRADGTPGLEPLWHNTAGALPPLWNDAVEFLPN